MGKLVDGMGDKFNAGFVEMQTGQDIRKVFESMINKKKIFFQKITLCSFFRKYQLLIQMSNCDLGGETD